MHESPPVDLDVLRRLDSTQVDRTNQGDTFLRVRSDVNAIATAAADEIEALRDEVRRLQAWIHAAVDWDHPDFPDGADCEWLCQKVCTGPCEGRDVGPLRTSGGA